MKTAARKELDLYFLELTRLTAICFAGDEGFAVAETMRLNVALALVNAPFLQKRVLGTESALRVNGRGKMFFQVCSCSTTQWSVPSCRGFRSQIKSACARPSTTARQCWPSGSQRKTYADTIFSLTATSPIPIPIRSRSDYRIAARRAWPFGVVATRGTADRADVVTQSSRCIW